MRIVQEGARQRSRAEGSGARRRIGLALGAVAYGGLMILAGAEMYRTGFFAEHVTPYLKGAWKWPVHMVQALRTSSPPRLSIDIQWEDYQKLAYQRQQALQASVLFADNSDFVPAAIRLDENPPVRIRMRLKGDGINHLRGEKWSFRVQTRDNQAIFGMTQFSLHHPQVRNWLFEWFGHRLMRREGVVALRYEFVDVTLNGKDLGLYALEEHFDKRLVENNARREGPVVRFNEELMWREIAEQTRNFADAQTNGIGDYLVSEPDGFQTGKMLDDDQLRGPYLKAIQLLHAFRLGELPTAEAFDAPLLARYFALVDLLGGEHGSRWHNIRFYYNPVTSRLEPIAFDLLGGMPTKALSITAMSTASAHDPFQTRLSQFQRSLFSDLEFCSLYLRELQRIVQPTYLDEVISEFQDDVQTALLTVYAEFPYYSFSWEVLRANRDYIQSVLNPHQAVHAYYAGSTGRELTLQLANIQYLPLSVVGVEIAGGETVEPKSSTILRPRLAERAAGFTDVVFHLGEFPRFTPDFAGGLVFLYKVLGTDTVRRTPVAPYSLQPEKLLSSDLLRRPGNVDRFPFLQVDTVERRICVQRGRWAVTEDLIVPPGFTLVGGAGVELDLQESAILLSRSPLAFTGVAEEPLVVRSSDGTGQGVLVLQADGSSILEHVHFDSLTHPHRDGWSLTGAVTFYESPVSFSHCVFSRNTCEDALNTIRSTFKLDHCLFQNTMFDAFDSDFCEGTVVDSEFLNIGNDAVDVSGSVAELHRVRVTGSRDKAVSVGEASRLTAQDLDIRNVRIGIAGKDLSEAQLDNVTMQECKYGVAALQKKPEFGPGTLHLRKLTMENVSQPYLIEENSVVTVDGRRMEPNSRNVKDIVYATAKPVAGASP